MSNVYLNNIYGNAAFQGALEGMLTGRRQTSTTQADYADVVNAAAAVAAAVDALIAFDALVTTGAAITQLAITTNTIAANEQHRAGLLQAITRAQFSGRNATSATAATYAVDAAAIKEVWDEGLTELVTP